MAKILFIANSHLKEPKRGTPLHLCNVLRALRADHQVQVCAASVPPEFEDSFIPYPETSRLLRFTELRRIVNAYHPDYVLSPNEGSVVPVALKFTCGVKIAVDLQGLGHEELYGDGSIGYVRYLYIRSKVWFFLHFYDIVFAVSKKLADHYASMSKDWVLVRGGVDAHEIPDVSDRPRDRSKFVLGYMGNARAYQGLPNLLQAAAILKARGIPIRLNLILSGNIDLIQVVLDTLDLRGITTLHRNVTHQEAGRLIAESDALSIPRPSIPITEYAFPSKLAECFATGIPTVLTEVGPVYELRSEFERCAFIVKTDHIPENLADAFESIFKLSDEDARALGKRARAFALKDLGWEVLGKTFSNAFVTQR